MHVGCTRTGCARSNSHRPLALGPGELHPVVVPAIVLAENVHGEAEVAFGLRVGKAAARVRLLFGLRAAVGVRAEVEPLMHLAWLLVLGRVHSDVLQSAQEAAAEEFVVQPVAGRRVGLLPWRRMTKWIQLQIISKL